MKKSILLTLLFVVTLSGCVGESSSGSTLTSSSIIQNSTNQSSYISISSQPLDYVFYESILYGTDARQVLEVAHNRDIQTPQKAVLFIHGGSWIGGDKSLMRRYQSLILDAGYVYVSMNYRFITSGADYLDMLDDITLALTFLKQYAEDLMIDTSRIVLVGESAGAHLAMLYAYRNQSVSPINIPYVMALVPPVDFTDPAFISFGDSRLQLFLANGLMGTNIENPDVLVLNGYPTSWVDASPYHHLTKAMPTLIAYAGNDELIPLSNMQGLIALSKEISAPIETIFFENSGHSLNLDPEKLDELFTRFIMNLKQYLG